MLFTQLESVFHVNTSIVLTKHSMVYFSAMFFPVFCGASFFSTLIPLLWHTLYVGLRFTFQYHY
uniref:Uncharacterized protein n=1 Tax=Arundo donax TaxID=35708 RepID=A0A0A9B2Q7_ARUDO